jgi:glycosyltransferase involved in cell wall biosynthesis
VPGLIVHEWLEPHGGAENVIQELRFAFPDAALRVLWNDDPARFPPSDTRETWLARTPLRRHKALAIPAMLAAWRQLPDRDVDWVLASSHLFAHHARLRHQRGVRKLAYVYTPARYIWEPELDARGSSRVARTAAKPLRRIDRRRAQEVDEIVAISAFVRQRIRTAWGRDAAVIYPPVDVDAYLADPAPALTEPERVLLDALPDEFLLGASRWVRYKRLDLVIETAAETGLPVVIAGSGPEGDALRALARERGVAAHFLDRPSRPLLSALYRRAVAYVFPGIEDFGIMPVEAMAAGTPVIGRAVGGVSETVQNGVTGILVDDFEPESVRAAVSAAREVDPADCRARAAAFSPSGFSSAMREWIDG